MSFLYCYVVAQAMIATPKPMFSNFSSAQSKDNLLHPALAQNDYQTALAHYEAVIKVDPENRFNYWCLGLIHLLMGNEVEAQTTWLFAMSEGTEADIETWTLELGTLLEQEAKRQQVANNTKMAWVLRSHLAEIMPDHLINTLLLLQLSLELNSDLEDALISVKITDLLANQDSLSEEEVLCLVETLQQCIDVNPLNSTLLEILEASFPYFSEQPTFFNTLLETSVEVAHSWRQPTIATRYLDLCLKWGLNDTEVLRHLAGYCQDAGQYKRGIELAQQCYDASVLIADKIFANHLILRGLTTTGGYWNRSKMVLERHYQLIESLATEHPTNLEPVRVGRLFNSSYELPYLQDDPVGFRKIQNSVASLCKENLQNYIRKAQEAHSQEMQSVEQTSAPLFTPSPSTPRAYFHTQKKKAQGRKLKVGYISYCMRQHSVGWLARWLISHHDREKFELYGYFLSHRQGRDSLENWYINQMDESCKHLKSSVDVAQRIHQDDIDILVDLDSITLDTTCEVMALKPAPIQVTWLGWDASGIPGIDYFIADPYVLPDQASNYYREDIWRLPEVYLAVDGFEVGVPTLRRDHLNVPSDAVVYFSSQRGFKRHPNTVKLQLQILKEVPNSYFLVKGTADQETVQEFFGAIAEDVGISMSRLRFLDQAPSEAIHRANLAIADVVLDTYPYNGATTTMETLWMGIPLVTRVGQQFAARNSYTMMVNAGIEEGIAWTDEEYIEWGIRLGADEKLRQQIHWKIMRSRHTAPLWNARRFTREMENAYQQMWAKYLESQS